jgi:hypothetical protein
LLKAEVEKRRNIERGSNDEKYIDILNTIESVRSSFEGYLIHLSLILTRCNRTTENIRDFIALRSSNHAAQENENMRNLTLESVREAKTVKAIAFVTLIYLPATFVAVSELFSIPLFPHYPPRLSLILCYPTYGDSRTNVGSDVFRYEQLICHTLQSWSPSNIRRSEIVDVPRAGSSADSGHSSGMVDVGMAKQEGSSRDA